MRRLPILLAALLLVGCATRRVAPRNDPVRTVLEVATSLLGAERIRVHGTPYRSDCSGFVGAAFTAAGVPLLDPEGGGGSGTERIYRSVRRKLGRRAALEPGDLVFFHNTYDRNGNGLRDDRFTHVGIVERVDRDGTVTFFHFGSGRVKRDVLNLDRPDLARDPNSGKVLNSYLRRGSGRVLSGQLFFRAARPLSR